VAVLAIARPPDDLKRRFLQDKTCTFVRIGSPFENQPPPGRGSQLALNVIDPPLHTQFVGTICDPGLKDSSAWVDSKTLDHTSEPASPVGLHRSDTHAVLFF
jgi:hypothetical protein